jgi:dTDP-4-amino-4,6-dideoxygalactose transaminase
MQSSNKQRERIYLSAPHMSGREQEYIDSAFSKNWVAPLGPNVDLFEKRLSEIHENRSVVALSSGTAALHLALIGAGVSNGDYVLCQSFTFCASANPIKYLGATPIFIGSEKESWNMSPEFLREGLISLRKVGIHPKAIVVTHLYGAPADMDAIRTIAQEFDSTVVEDAAESLGSFYRDRPAGTLARWGVLSFNGNKIITTSGGGALICPDEATAHAMKHLATQARDPAPYYLHTKIGFNYRLSNICAGIGCGQLEVLKERVARRRNNFDFYRDRLGGAEGIDFRDSVTGCFENRWLSTVLLSKSILDQTPLLEGLRKLDESNIECRPLWKPLHTQPVFSGTRYFGDRLEEDLFARGLCLPSSSFLDQEHLERVVDLFRSVFLDVGTL